MVNLKSIIMLITITLLLNACAIKQTDTTTDKTVKHIANAPLYAVMLPGMLFTAAGGAVGYGVSKSIDALADVEIYFGEVYLGKHKEQKLDNNISLSKFYTDSDFALYKDKNNKNCVLFKPSNDFIKDVDFTHKRWSIARLEGRPYLHVKKFRLPDDLERGYIFSKFEKDKFGNPIFFGDNIVVELNQYYSATFFTKYSDLYLIVDGALTIDRKPKDINIPINIDKQIAYFFKNPTL